MCMCVYWMHKTEPRPRLGTVGESGFLARGAVERGLCAAPGLPPSSNFAESPYTFVLFVVPGFDGISNTALTAAAVLFRPFICMKTQGPMSFYCAFVATLNSSDTLRANEDLDQCAS